jgi:hypothetical protein
MKMDEKALIKFQKMYCEITAPSFCVIRSQGSAGPPGWWFLGNRQDSGLQTPAPSRRMPLQASAGFTLPHTYKLDVIQSLVQMWPDDGTVAAKVILRRLGLQFLQRGRNGGRVAGASFTRPRASATTSCLGWPRRSCA